MRRAPLPEPARARLRRLRRPARAGRSGSFLRTLLLALLVSATAWAQSGAPSPEGLWAEGERRAAIASLTASLGEVPRAEAVAQLVRWQLQVHQYQAALETIERHAAPLPDLRGEALYALTRYDEALEHLDPSDPRHALLVVDALEALGRLEEAEAALERARRVLPDDPRLHGFSGRSRARAGDHAGAIAAFRRALEVNPIDMAALFGLGRSLLATGQREAGLAALEEHRRCVPLVDALDFARQSLDLAPNFAPNLAAVGDAERALGLLEAARIHYVEALARAEGEASIAVALRLARLLDEDLGDVDAAVAVLDEAFEVAADARLAVRAGDVLRASERYPEALARYDRGLALRPDDRAIQARRRAVLEALR